MSGDERLVLDARVVDVLSTQAFVAQLENGHRFTAFVVGKDDNRETVLSAGHEIRVVFSPFDMTKAKIVFVEEAEKDDESAQFSPTDV